MSEVLARRCLWCDRLGPYNEGSLCRHPPPNNECSVHGRWTDINLVTRGRRAVVKCAHYGQAWVVLFADPIADDKDRGTYTLQFAMVGVGQEQYTIEAKKLLCPHHIFDKLVAEMREGARPSANRVPPPESQVVDPGKELPHG